MASVNALLHPLKGARRYLSRDGAYNGSKEVAHGCH